MIKIMVNKISSKLAILNNIDGTYPNRTRHSLQNQWRTTKGQITELFQFSGPG